MKKTMRSHQETTGQQPPQGRPRLSPELSEFMHMLSAIEDRIASNPEESDEE